MIYKLFHTVSQQIKGYRPLFNAKSFRKCTHSERGGSHVEWTASLYIFAVPALWNSSPTAHHNDAILHSPTQPLCKVLTLLLHVNALFHFIIESLFKAITPSSNFYCGHKIFYRIFTKIPNSNIYLLQILF